MRPWRKPEISLRRAEISDGDILSEMHSGAFRRGWSGAEFEALLGQPGVAALLAFYRRAIGPRAPAGFLLYRTVQDEAEILSVGVVGECRRRGIARLLLEEGLRDVYREGVRRVHLEVEESNLAAITLYRRMEFVETGSRPGYYGQGQGSRTGALVMLRQLR